MDFEPTGDHDDSHHHDPPKEDEPHRLTSFLSLKWEYGPGFAAGSPSFEALGASLQDDSRTPETQKPGSARRRQKFSQRLHRDGVFAPWSRPLEKGSTARGYTATRIRRGAVDSAMVGLCCRAHATDVGDHCRDQESAKLFPGGVLRPRCICYIVKEEATAYCQCRGFAVNS